MGPRRRLPLHIGDDRLLGGLDLAATLRSGRPLVQRGLLAECDGGILTLPMAERTPPALAAKLAAVMDAGAVVLERDALAARHQSAFGLVLLDEGLAEDEAPPGGLLDRLAFHLRLEPPEAGAPLPFGLDALAVGEIAAARRRLPDVGAGDDAVEALCATSLALGIASARAPSFAPRRRTRRGRALRARPGQRGRHGPGGAAWSWRRGRPGCRPRRRPRNRRSPSRRRSGATARRARAARIGPRKRETGSPWRTSWSRRRRPRSRPTSWRGSWPARAGTAGLRGAGRAGPLRAGSGRGRPVGARRGAPGQGQRLNVLATLRAAAPWQAIRRHELPEGQRVARAGVLIRREDFRVTRTKHHPETTTIFVVDASGSAALHRLAEAKGAVELLLADCYVRRDSVALLTFSGRSAELLLPPTRSLVRVKRSLAGFPAGGGTPLASAIDATAALAEGLRRKGQSPVAVFLTDGRGNIARDGTADRERAESDARAAARALAAGGLASLLVDISPRPRPVGRRLAEDLGATYLALPQADAAALSSAVQAHTPPAG